MLHSQSVVCKNFSSSWLFYYKVISKSILIFGSAVLLYIDIHSYWQILWTTSYIMILTLIQWNNIEILLTGVLFSFLDCLPALERGEMKKDYNANNTNGADSEDEEVCVNYFSH